MVNYLIMHVDQDKDMRMHTCSPTHPQTHPPTPTNTHTHTPIHTHTIAHIYYQCIIKNIYDIYMIYKYVYACISWTFSIGKYIKIINLCFSIFLPFPKECIPKHSVPLTKSAWRRHRSASGQRNAAALWHHRATLLYIR